MSTFKVKYHAKDVWELSNEAEIVRLMQLYPAAKRLGSADMAKRREHKRQRKAPKTDDDVDLNGPKEPPTDDAYVKVTLTKVVDGLTDDRKQLKSLLGARHIDLFKTFCILHYKTA